MEQRATQIVGRAEEQATLAAFVAGPAPRILVLEGIAGSGKTTLWEESLEDASHRVLAARPSEAEASLPLSTLGDLLAEIDLEALTGLPLPQQRMLGAALLLEEPSDVVPVEPRGLSVAFVSVLRELARERPVLVAVDDVGWADPGSAAILGFAARRLGDARIHMLLSARQAVPTDPPPLGLDRIDGVQRLRIGPLRARDTADLLRARLDPPPSPTLAQAIHERSGGNPFYALELGRAAADAPPGTPLDEVLPARALHALVGDRIARLPADTSDALLAVALLADPRLDALDRLEVSATLEHALHADVIRITGHRVVFAHPLLASAARAHAGAISCRRMHARLAAVVTDSGQRTRHLALAAAGPDPDLAVSLDEAAGDAGARGDVHGATELGELAVQLVPDGDPRMAAIFARTAAHALQAGRSKRAAELAHAALRAATSGGERADALALLAATTHDMSEALSLCDAALAEAGDDVQRLIELRANRLLALAINGRPAEAVEEARRIAALGKSLEASDIVAWAESQHGFLARMCGTADRDRIERAASAARDAGAGAFGYTPAQVRALGLMYDDRLDEAREFWLRELSAARERGDEVTVGTATFHLAEVECRAGRYAVAEGHVRESLTTLEVGELPQDRSGALYALAWALAALGRADEARARAEEGARLSRDANDRLYEIPNEIVLGFLELSLGRPEAAARRLRPLWPALTAMGYGEPGIWPVLPDLIEALVAIGEADEAESWVDELEARGRALDSCWALGHAARGRGLMAAARGSPEAALAHFDAALTHHDRVPRPFDRARTLLSRGATLRRAMRRADARAALGAALAIFEEIGTPLWADRARDELARIGGRSPAGDALTATERRVAELVARGLANKEVAAELFVTVRTVEANLTRIYAKLGVRSRSELARRLTSDAPR